MKKELKDKKIETDISMTKFQHSIIEKVLDGRENTRIMTVESTDELSLKMKNCLKNSDRIKVPIGEIKGKEANEFIKKLINAPSGTTVHFDVSD